MTTMNRQDVNDLIPAAVLAAEDLTRRVCEEPAYQTACQCRSSTLLRRVSESALYLSIGQSSGRPSNSIAKHTGAVFAQKCSENASGRGVETCPVDPASLISDNTQRESRAPKPRVGIEHWRTTQLQELTEECTAN